MTDWYAGDPELFVPASDVYPRLHSLERRVTVLLGSTIAAWLLVLAVAVSNEMKQAYPIETVAAQKGDLLITGNVPKGQ